jgi:hypothetical protein
MSMDLIPVNPTAERLRFTNSYWRMLIELFAELHIDTTTLTTFNDGELIPESICQAIADRLEERLDDFVNEDKPFVEHLLTQFRHSEGFRQW